MNHIEAMKQWLEALEKAQPYLSDALQSVGGMAEYEADLECGCAITALRTAIEAAEKQEPVAWGVDWGKAGDIPCVSIIKRLPDGGIEVLAVEYAPYSYTAPPAAPVQEPLEYWNAVEGWVKIDEVRQHFDSVGCGTIYKNAGEDRVPLYTAAQRKWVGLTDDAVYAAAEIAWRAGWAACRDAEFVGEEAEDEAWGYQGATVAHDTEAKLREKNAAQRQSARSAWVGLTDDDIWKDDKIMELNANTGLYMDELVGIARAIEAKLKEKNT